MAAETIVGVIVEGVLGRLGSLTVQATSDVKTESTRLENTLSSLKSILLYAENQHAKNPAVKDWLEKLKDVVYDIDDALDDFDTEARRRKVEVQGSLLKEVYSFFSLSNPFILNWKMSQKIKEIREKLEDISADWRNFQFAEQVVVTQDESRVREPTHSFVRESDVIGRDHDKRRLLQLLLSFSDHEDLSVIPIVGLGGLGKTTLAKLVYNDREVTKNFELRSWVCISEDFRLKKVVGKVLKSLTGADNDREDVDRLQTCLRNSLYAKKFLLVLDDVWNDDSNRWAELKDLLVGGAKGSAVIVTTRSQKVASIMGTVQSYSLCELPYDYCFSLFMRCAFKDGYQNEHPELVDVGREIVAKCGGVPLAVKTLGSLLHIKTDLHEWLYVKNSDIWRLEQKENDILPALRLSYEQLPFYLKQCFVYCSVFPKGHEIVRNELIYQWMAQGLIESPDGSRQLEDVGNQFFNELLSRSFFQVEERDVDFDSQIAFFKMHDLLHDLAQLLAGQERLDVYFDSQIISERVRHVVFCEEDLLNKEFPRPLLSARKMRSFRFLYHVGPLNKSFLDALILNFPCLRVLRLRGSWFEELPVSISNLKHLRYLSVSENPEMKALPNSICKLLNLQALYLFNCEQLQDLPVDVGKLMNLRYLYLTSRQICLPEAGLQGLISLRTLILDRCYNLVSLTEGMQYLTSLKELCIQYCPCLTSLPSGMKYLTTLEKLKIIDCHELNLLGVEAIRGLKGLRSLKMTGLPKLVVLPRGLQQSAINLRFLFIGDCPGLKALPEWLKHLTLLQRLFIWDCLNLMRLPKGVRHLSRLRKLDIQRCPHLRRRCKRETGEDWPNISHVPHLCIDSDDGNNDEEEDDDSED